MSLTCGQCKQDLGPSLSLPGREGAMVTPILKAVVPGLTSEGNISWTESMAVGSARVALCFECIESTVPDRAVLEKYYEFYAQELKCERLYWDQMRHSPLNWYKVYIADHGQQSEFRRAADRLIAINESLKAAGIINECPVCGRELAKNEPYMLATGISRLMSGMVLSGFEQNNYSLSHLFEGLLKFSICNECFVGHFPRAFADLAYAMGTNEMAREASKPELIISASVLSAAMESSSEDGRKEIAAIIDRMESQGNLTIDLGEEGVA